MKNGENEMTTTAETPAPYLTSAYLLFEFPSAEVAKTFADQAAEMIARIFENISFANPHKPDRESITVSDGVPTFVDVPQIAEEYFDNVEGNFLGLDDDLQNKLIAPEPHLDTREQMKIQQSIEDKFEALAKSLGGEFIGT